MATCVPAVQTSLSADEARRIALRAQGLLGAPDRRAGVAGVLDQLGAVQLDTISVLARSHELVAYARLGAVGRERVEAALWGTGLTGAGSTLPQSTPPQSTPPKSMLPKSIPTASAQTFEYWSHAACVLPLRDWPSFAFRRRHFRARGWRWHKVPDGLGAEVLARLRAEGPLTATELGGARQGEGWWSWSGTKIAVEWLLDIGEVVCTSRRGWKRVYDLAERALPASLLDEEPDDAECLRSLVAGAGAALGVATRSDLADYHRLRGEQVDAVVAESGLVPVEVEGWGARAWADPAALAAPIRGRHRTTLLSPFDSLVWDRRRTERIFSFAHKLEAYVPAQRRIHGYYAMPLLTGGRLRGRADPVRKGTTLHALRVSVDGPGDVEPMATALREAAGWTGCDAVEVGQVRPEHLSAELKAACAA